MTGLATAILRAIELTTARPSQRQHDQANDNTTKPTATRPSKLQHDRANDSTTELTTARPSQRQHDRANDNTIEPTTTRMRSMYTFAYGMTADWVSETRSKPST
jgi:hypothetical protein